MATKQSDLTGVYFVALTLLGIACAYRLVYYWFGTVAIPGPDAQAAWFHLHIWLPITAAVAVLWAMAARRLLQEMSVPKKKEKENHISVS